MIQTGGVYTRFSQEGDSFAKSRDRNGRCIVILFKSIGSGVDLTFLTSQCWKASEASVSRQQSMNKSTEGSVASTLCERPWKVSLLWSCATNQELSIVAKSITNFVPGSLRSMSVIVVNCPQKSAIFVSKTLIFDIPTSLQNTMLAPLHTICAF